MHNLAVRCKGVLETDKLTSLADKGYIPATDIAKYVADNITANVCMDDETLDFCIETQENCAKPTAYNNGRIVYLKNRNICVYPMGEVLYPGSDRKKRCIVRYYNTKACAKCLQKCTSARFAEGEIVMKKSQFSKAYDDKNLKLKQIHYVPDKQLLKRRKCLSEHPFGIVKRGLGADYFLLKRISRVTAEMTFTYLAFNMKRVINILGFDTVWGYSSTSKNAMWVPTCPACHFCLQLFLGLTRCSFMCIIELQPINQRRNYETTYCNYRVRMACHENHLERAT